MRAPTGPAWRSVWFFLALVCVAVILANQNWRSALNPEDFYSHADGFADVSLDEQAPADNQITSTLSPPQISRMPAFDPAVKFAWIETQASAPLADAFENQFAAPPSSFVAWSSSSVTPSVASLAQPSHLQSGNLTSLPMATTHAAHISSATTAAIDPTWIGPSLGSWSNPGNWSPAGVPNGPGVIVNFQPSGAGTMVTSQNVSTGVTVGSLSLEGTGPTTWHIQLSTEMTFNNNGNGAVLSIVNTAAGGYGLVFPSDHPMILADNLAVTNSSGSTNVSGSMILASIITGTGNITFNNVSNNRTAGQIALTPTASSTFIGSSTIASGAVTFSNNSAFGGAGNQVVLGSSGGGSATLVSTGTGNNLGNSILVASGSGGTLTLGSTSPDLFANSTFSGSITLNGDVSLLNPTANAAATIFSNTISGVGGITKVGAGGVLLSGNNTFTGATTVNQGNLFLNAVNALGGTSSITVNSGGTLILSGSTSSTNNRINDSAELILNGNGVASNQVQAGGRSEHGATNNTAGIGAVTLQSSSIIDLGGGSSVIAFANSSAKTWTGTLSIYNWNGNAITGNGGDQVYFGSGITGLTLAQLSQISFYSGSGTGFLGTGAWAPDLDGEVVPIPVPEPSTWIAGALAFGAIGFLARRKRKRLKS